MTILLYVLHEHSYDRWQANAGRIFQVTGTLKMGNAAFHTERLSYATGPIVRQSDGNVEAFIRAFPESRPVNLSNPGRPGLAFTEKNNWLFADSNFFRVFSFRLLKGNAAAILQRPYTVVLTEQAARKYFGQTDPIGRTLRYNGLYNFEVTGVTANLPSNTGFDFDFVASMVSLPSMSEYQTITQGASVQGGSFRTWLLLKDAAAAAKVKRTIDRLAIVPGQPVEDRDAYTLTALSDVHLHSDFGDASNIRYLRFFPLVAGLVLLLALINYMSLATARAATRAKEVGVRKVMGAGRGRIAGQFYAESALNAVLAFALGTGLFLLIRVWFFGLLQLKIDPSFLFDPRVLAGSGALLLIVIGLAGSYPSLVLSAFRPVAVLYGKLSRRRGGERVRKVFIVFQFTISMILVSGSVIIVRELHYIRNTETGVDRDNIVMVPYSDKLRHYAAFKREVEALPSIAGAATANYPLYGGLDAWSVKRPDGDKPTQLYLLNVDQDYIRLLGLRWKEEPADRQTIGDGQHILLNEKATENLGFDGNARGQRLAVGNEKLLVAGVLTDFNFTSLRSAIGPLGIFIANDTAAGWEGRRGGCLLAKIKAQANLPATLEAVRNLYRKYDPQTAFSFDFADEAFDRQYKAEDRLAGLMGLFTGITIIIACLGLFALATFSARQRLKEIGIRKALGASTASIGSLLSRDFLRPVLLAVLIASPVSWWLMSRWLEDFAYRTPVSGWLFAAAGGGLLAIALATVLIRCVQAARTNPVEHLRVE
jgi:putative ABC transport system permease protein